MESWFMFWSKETEKLQENNKWEGGEKKSRNNQFKTLK